jgi:hypothetical protein
MRIADATSEAVGQHGEIGSKSTDGDHAMEEVVRKPS